MADTGTQRSNTSVMASGRTETSQEIESARPVSAWFVDRERNLKAVRRPQAPSSSRLKTPDALS
jgi:hypothetical protein